MKSAKLLSIGTYLLVVFALLAGCVPVPPRAPVAPSAPVAAPAEARPPPEPRGLRPDAPPYAVHGPYAVGVRDLVVEPQREGERPLTVSVWYPALNPEGAEEAITYTMGFPTNENPNFPIYGHALADAVPDLSGGPYPLVVYSHGAYTFRQQVPYLVEHLASRGFVVMAADHEDNWGTLFTPTLASEVSRPADIKRQLGLATELTAGAGALAGMIDTERVAVAGYSFGGEIAMEMGGARLNLVEWQHSFCTVYPEEGDCVAYRDHLGEIAALAGLGAVPEGLWPDWSDPRVDVIVALAPNCTMFGGGGLENVRWPILFAVGSKDSMAGPGIEYRHCFETLPSTRKTRVVFENADHLLFMSACAAHPGMAEAGFFWVCSDPVWDMDRAHDLANHFVTAFLLAELKGDAEAAKALAPENVSFPGIQYETTAYAAAVKPEAKLDDATVAKIEAIVQAEMAESQVPGMSLCIMKDGQMVYSQGFGVAELGTKRPVTPQTMFKLASITKMFTAVAIMQLVEQGKIDLDAPVTDYLPWFTMADPRYRDITVRQVMSHRAGIPPLADPIEPFYLSWGFDHPNFDDQAMERRVRELSEQTLLHKPGEAYAYSDWGFTVLGQIVASVSGELYEDYITHHILEPLDMTQSTLFPLKVEAALLASPHVNAPSGEVIVSPVYPYTRDDAPADALHTSCQDMAKWAQASLNRGELNGTRILQPSSYDTMWESLSRTGLEDWLGRHYGLPLSGYGMGWYSTEIDGIRVIGHAGVSPGFTAQMFLAPDQKLAVIALANWQGKLDVPFSGIWVATDVLYELLGIDVRQLE